MTLDEEDTRASRIVFYDKKSEGQGLSDTPETSTTGTGARSGDQDGNDPTSECSRSLQPRPILTRISVSPSEGNTGDTNNEEVEPSETSGGMCWCQRIFRISLTSIGSRGGPYGYSSLDYPHSRWYHHGGPRCRERASRWIRIPQGRSGRHLRRLH